MSTAYYLYRKASVDREMPEEGSLLGVFSATKPGPTFTWAINPALLITYFHDSIWVQDQYKNEPIILPAFADCLKHCPIQHYNKEEMKVGN